jgi:hypothetical protein
MDIDAVEREAERRALTGEEIGGLAALLQSAARPQEQHRAVLLLAREHTADGEHALHALLEGGATPEIAVLALETLCVRWGLTERYAGMLRHFVRGVRWDVEHGGDVRRAAIAIAGQHLASHSDTELMFDIIRVSEDEPDDATRTAAVRALARATGYRGRPVDLNIDL